MPKINKIKGYDYLGRAVDDAGQEYGNILYLFTPPGSRRQRTRTTDTINVEDAKRKARQWQNHDAMMDARGSDVTWGAVWEHYEAFMFSNKMPKEKQSVAFDNERGNWQRINALIEHRKISDHRMDQGWWDRWAEDVRIGRNGARVLTSKHRKLQPLAPDTLWNYLALVLRLRRFACGTGQLIGEWSLQPLTFIKPGDGTGKQQRTTKFYTRKEREKLIATLQAMTDELGTGRPHWLHVYVICALGSAVRTSRNLEARWDLVDWEKGTIDYSRVFSPDDQRDKADAKHLRGRKPGVTMRIRAWARPVLRAAYEHDLRRCEGSVKKVGKLPIVGPGVPQLIDRDFRRLTKRALGEDRGTPHWLKHTAITIMVESGLSPAQVSKLTNTSLKTIMEVYYHEDDDAANAAIDQAFPVDDKVASLEVHRDRKRRRS